MWGGQRKNLYSNYLRNAGTLSKIVLTNGVWIWAIRIVMWTCWRFLIHFVYLRTNWACFSINACTLTSEYGSVRYVSTLQKRWCWNIQIIATTSFQLSVDSLVELIFTESSRQKKAVLLQHGETSTLQMQHKMTQKYKVPSKHIHPHFTSGNDKGLYATMKRWRIDPSSCSGACSMDNIT